MSLNVILVFFIVRLVATLLEHLGVNGADFPWEFNGDLLSFSGQFIYSSVSIAQSIAQMN